MPVHKIIKKYTPQQLLQERDEYARKIDHILDSITDAFIMLDKHWNIRDNNKQVEHYFSLKKNKLIGKNLLQLDPQFIQTDFYKHLSKAYTSKKKVTFEALYPSLKRWFAVNTFPVREGLAVYFSDITKRKEIENNLRYLAELSENISDAVVGMDLQFRFTTWNKGAEKLYGWKREEVIGERVTHIIPTEFITDSDEIFVKQLQAKGYWKGEVIQTKQDGSRMYAYASVSPIKNQLNKTIGFVAVNRDITIQKEIEKKLQESETHFRTVVEQVNDLISVLNLQGEIVYTSPSLKKVLGYDNKELHGERFTSLLHPDDLQLAEKAIQQAIIKKSSATIIVRVKHKDGQYVYIEGGATTMYDEKNLTSLIIVARNVTSRVALERRKDEFISMASHELKTPITTIKAFTQILARQFTQSENPIAATYLSKMDAQVNKLTDLIVNMLEVSRTQQGKLQFHFQDFNLNDLLQNVLEDLQETITTHRILLKGDFNKTVYGDKDRINQVIVNLITNAVKYSPEANKILITISSVPMIKTKEKSPTPQLQHKKTRSDKITLAVTDYGIGIPEKHKKRIFEKFYRVEDSNQRSHYPGLGVGLYIAAEIVQRHGGKIWVESSGSGHGSTFYFSLPVKTN